MGLRFCLFCYDFLSSNNAPDWPDATPEGVDESRLHLTARRSKRNRTSAERSRGAEVEEAGKVEQYNVRVDGEVGKSGEVGQRDYVGAGGPWGRWTMVKVRRKYKMEGSGAK